MDFHPQSIYVCMSVHTCSILCQMSAFVIWIFARNIDRWHIHATHAILWTALPALKIVLYALVCMCGCTHTYSWYELRIENAGHTRTRLWLNFGSIRHKIVWFSHRKTCAVTFSARAHSTQHYMNANMTIFQGLFFGMKSLPLRICCCLHRYMALLSSRIITKKQVVCDVQMSWWELVDMITQKNLEMLSNMQPKEAYHLSNLCSR